MALNSFSIVEGDYGEPLAGVLLDATDTPTPLSGGNQPLSLTLTLKNRNSGAILVAAGVCTVTTATYGSGTADYATYQFVPPELADGTAGYYEGRISATWTPGEPISFPNSVEGFTVVIAPRLR